MAMNGGFVTVKDDESHVGTGLALAMYEALKATLDLPPVPKLGDTAPPCSKERPVTQFDIDLLREQRLRLLRRTAAQAAALGVATVQYMKAHAVVVVTNESLGRLPANVKAGEAIQGPASPVTLKVS
jgi:hypothetical protein